jgi:hypothetical protein
MLVLGDTVNCFFPKFTMNLGFFWVYRNRLFVTNDTSKPSLHPEIIQLYFQIFEKNYFGFDLMFGDIYELLTFAVGSFLLQMAAKGRTSGQVNYKNDILANVVESIIPISALDWMTVCDRYKEATGEPQKRDYHDLKRQFIQDPKCCNSNKKITGSAAPKPLVARCQAIYLKICKRVDAGNYGASRNNDSDSDTEYDSSDDETNMEEGKNDDRNEDTNQDDDEMVPEEEDNWVPERNAGPGIHPFQQGGRDIQAAPLHVAIPVAAVPAPRANPLAGRPPRGPGGSVLGTPAPALAMPVPVQAANQAPRAGDAKRKAQPVAEEQGKSKNVRNNPRGSAGAALTNLANVLTQKHATQVQPNPEHNLTQVLMMQMQMQQQSQNHQFQMMMMMMSNKRDQDYSPGQYSNASYKNSSNGSYRLSSFKMPSSTSSSSSSSSSTSNMSQQSYEPSNILDHFDEHDYNERY